VTITLPDLVGTIYHGGRPHHLFSDGTRLPVISGGDGPRTVSDIEAERGQVMTELTDLLATAQARPEAERGLTDDERTQHDAAVARFDTLSTEIEAARTTEGDAARFAAHDARRSAAFPIPHINVGVDSPSANRSLDELLWATDDSVAAGSFDKTGNFRQHSVARNAVEQVVVRNADDTMVQAPRINEFLPNHRQAIRGFQKTVADMALFGLMIDKSAKSSADGFEVARSHKLFKDRWNHALRALDTDTSAEGTEWIPTGTGAAVHEKVRASGKVAPLFSRIDLPTNPWKWPIEGADSVAYRVPEPTSDTATKVTASTPGTGAVTFDAEIFGGRTLFSKSLEADSAVAILPYSWRKLVQAFVDAEEKAILDGDTDGTHQDADVGASTTDARTAWDGLRKKALADTVATATTITALNLGVVRKAMGKWGVNPSDLAFIIGVSNLHTLMADTNLLTVDKMGPNAVILNGQIGSVFGVPVIVSEHVREGLNASGVQDGITATKTYMLCVNRNEWVMGQRMALDVEVDDSIYRETYQRVVVAFQRQDFQCIGGSGDENTAIAYNVTP
jgi:HK97 family phage major capsid protein